MALQEDQKVKADQFVGDEEFHALLDSYFEPSTGADWISTRYLETAIELGINPYRVCMVYRHTGMLWGRYKGAYTWEFEFSSSFAESLKHCGEYQFKKERGFRGWRSRPNGLAACEDLIAGASRHFTHLVDADRSRLLVTRSKDLYPPADTTPFRDRWKPVTVRKKDVLAAISRSRPNDILDHDSLRICNGMRFVSFPDDGEILLRYRAALFTIACDARFLRTFTCGVSDDGDICVSRIGYGSDATSSTQQIAEYREMCNDRAPWCLPNQDFGDASSIYNKKFVPTPPGRFKARLLEKEWMRSTKAWKFTWEVSNGAKVEIIVSCRNPIAFPIDENLDVNRFTPQFSDTNMGEAEVDSFFDLTVGLTRNGNPVLLDAIPLDEDKADWMEQWGSCSDFEVEHVEFRTCSAFVKSTGKSCKQMARLDGDLCNMHTNREVEGKEVIRVEV